MSGTERGPEAKNGWIVLGLLESVERDGAQSQRKLASELGIALGLVNAYLKRCIKKGLLKVGEAPARRYAYYLTPQGFAEKSRLTVDYLSYSFSFFRQAKADCQAALESAKSSGVDRIVLAGCSDLAEVATICAREVGMSITAIVDPFATARVFVGVPVVQSFVALAEMPQTVLITDLTNTKSTALAAAAYCGADRVFTPALLGGRPINREENRA